MPLKVIFPAPPKSAATRIPQPGDVITITYHKGDVQERHYTGVMMKNTNRLFVLATKGAATAYSPFETLEIGTPAHIEFHDKAVLVIGGGVE